MSVLPYLFFDGCCEEVVAFYRFDEAMTLCLHRLGY
jgi:uncharacterized glyoxalase superfamily protein PhnB